MRNAEESYKIRLAVVFYTILIISIIFMIKLINIQVFNRNQYLEEVEAQINKDYNIIKAERGQILDRNGEILAFSELVFQLDINPNLMTKQEKDILQKELPKILGITQLKAQEYLQHNEFVVVSRSVTLEQKEKIEKLDVNNGLTLTRIYKRVYPFGEYLSPILGFVGADGEGLAGIELQFNDYLKGKDGRIFKNFVSTRPILPGEESFSVAAEKGKDIFLTIDKNIQYKAQSIIEKKVKELNAQRGMILVANPQNGEILAIANYPSYNPTTLESLENSVNMAVNWNYEPGSVVKPLVATGALQSGVLHWEDSFYCAGAIKVKDRIISCWKKHGKEEGLKEILKNSCDVAFAEVGLKMGKENLIEFYKKIGFGSPTGIELPGEEKGIIPDVNKINEVETATMSFGQGVAVTPIQFVSAFSSIINNGIQYKPYIVKKITDNNANIVMETLPIIRNFICSEKMSKELREALVYTVNEGIKNAKIQGISVLGKTGTAQKIVDGKYSRTKLIYSFIGAFPAEQPEIVVFVVIDETPTAMYSIDITPPIFKELAEFVIKYLRIGNEG